MIRRGTAVPRGASVQRPPEQRVGCRVQHPNCWADSAALQPRSHKPPTLGGPATPLPARRAGRHRQDITLRELLLAGRIGIAATAVPFPAPWSPIPRHSQTRDSLLQP